MAIYRIKLFALNEGEHKEENDRKYCIDNNIFAIGWGYKETGQYRKGELGSKPLNIEVLYGNLGLQKSPRCPISV